MQGGSGAYDGGSSSEQRLTQLGAGRAGQVWQDDNIVVVQPAGKILKGTEDHRIKGDVSLFEHVYDAAVFPFVIHQVGAELIKRPRIDKQDPCGALQFGKQLLMPGMQMERLAYTFEIGTVGIILECAHKCTNRGCLPLPHSDTGESDSARWRRP